MIISTPCELITYIQNNFDCLTREEYIKLINVTLKVYPFEKPESAGDSIRMIYEMAFIPLEIRPLLV